MRIVEHTARIGITVGGLTVIAAVLAIMVFLAATVMPLFGKGEARLEHAGKVGLGAGVIVAQVDEYRGMATLLGSDGVLRSVLLEDGRTLGEKRVIPDRKQITAHAFSRQHGAIAIGYADGMVQLGKVGFESEFANAESAGEAGKAMAVGARVGDGDGYLERTGLDSWRRVRPAVELQEPTELKSGTGAVLAMDYRPTGSADLLVALREGGAELDRVEVRRPLGGGKPKVTLNSTEFKTVVAKDGRRVGVFVSGDGAHIFEVFHTGVVQRYGITRSADGDDLVVAGDQIRATDEGETVSSAGMLLGGRTLILGTDKGRVLALFAVQRDGSQAPDRHSTVVAHRHTGTVSGEIRTVGISVRDRSYLVGDAVGAGALRNMTSGKTIAAFEGKGQGSSPMVVAEISPKGDGVLLVRGDGQYEVWHVDPGHSEASADSLFGKVWYEGEPEPSFTYQSSSGEDSAEPKLSVTPLIWGTLKATIYAMLFAVPLAILAALYTSEMLHPSVRNRVKPVVEMMASLPSVVLGFIAALVIAPLARDLLPGILMAFFVVPIGVLLAAYVWQMLPIRVATRIGSGRQFAILVCVTVISMIAAVPIGRLAERVLFTPTDEETLVLAGSVTPVEASQWPESVKGRTSLEHGEQRALQKLGLYWRNGEVVRPTGAVTDPAVAKVVQEKGLADPSIRLWLDGVIGGAWAGWFMLMFGPAAALALLLKARFINPLLETRADLRIGFRAAVAELVKFAGVLVLAAGIAGVMVWGLTAIGMDARDSVLGPFNQRNSLVVGIIMGFAIIPIIYTVSEDALSAVSPALRSASLGAGATRWQTAVRVVLPVAASGIFSACMIGLGRATGETMIVLMATGNTPSMDPSIFSGFRTLAANIAVELPEAAVSSTHYRVLFLCGLVLLVLTFAVNTVAEHVRQKFRRRVAGL